MFKEAYAKSQASDKLISKRLGPFNVKSLIDKNAVQVELPSYLKMHNVINSIHTVPYFEQPDEIAAEVPNKPDTVPRNNDEDYVVEAILKHRRKVTD